MKAYYTLEIRDRDGKLLRLIWRRSHSFVQQYNEFIALQMGQVVDLSMKDTGGTDRNMDKNALSLRCNANAGVVVHGIRVGTGATAVAISDYALETPIAQGAGSGQLPHGAVTVGTPSVSGSECSFTITRVMINGSGATITVTEIGIYSGGHDGSDNRFFLVVRDVLTSSQAVPDGGAITVVYTIKVTV